jgi:hypothetical protein
MTNYWEKTLIDLVEKTKAGVEKGVDFAMQEAPKFIEELLKWKFYESLLAVVAAVLAFAILTTLYIVVYRKMKDADEESRIITRVLSTLIFLAVSCAVIFPTAFRNTKTMVEIKVAPRVYLVDYAASLMKSEAPSK